MLALGPAAAVSALRSVYRELAPSAPLRDLLACRWTQAVGVGGHVQRVVPDGCVDVVLVGAAAPLVAGPATRATLVALAPHSTIVGVRFRPGAAAGVLGLPLSELCDRNVPLAELWGAPAVERLADELAAATGAEEQIALLERAVLVRRRDAPPPDRLIAAAARVVGSAPAEVRVREIGDSLGVSERQLLRRFRAAVGYGPKMLARVLRFQRFATAGWGASEETTLARLAADAGYADHAHLARDCRQLAGVAPGVVLGRG
ncbi:MAG: Helix-turn-helix, AraC domain protein [Conexibacter sp.]|nr:Helix-turn-helix, AraC domain protein [Conexibacter sp.]